MNPLTNVKNITKLNETELSAGTTNKKSWHDIYKESAWIFIGGLPYDLTEGDVLTVFSQYGEIVNINLVRDKKTGKTKGFCFLCYANQKSTVLAVDNLNGIKICSRTIRVDHVANYKPPKEDERDDELTKTLKAEGCAPKPFKAEPTEILPETQKKRKVKKEKKKKKDKKPDKKEVKVKVEKQDPGYDKYEYPNKYSEAKEQYEHKSQKFDKNSSYYRNSIKNDANDKQNKFDNYHLKNKNSASISKYPSGKKRYSDSSSSSNSSSDSESDNRKKRKKSSNEDLRLDSSYTHYSETNKETDNKYRHKFSNEDSHRKHEKSREYKDIIDESRHKSTKYNRHDSLSSSDEDRSSKRHEKRTKQYSHDRKSVSDKSSSSFYEQKHRSHTSSRREEYYLHKERSK